MPGPAGWCGRVAGWCGTRTYLTVTGMAATGPYCRPVPRTVVVPRRCPTTLPVAAVTVAIDVSLTAQVITSLSCWRPPHEERATLAVKDSAMAIVAAAGVTRVPSSLVQFPSSRMPHDATTGPRLVIQAMNAAPRRARHLRANRSRASPMAGATRSDDMPKNGPLALAAAVISVTHLAMSTARCPEDTIGS